MCLNKQRAEIQIGEQLGYVSTTVTVNSATQTVNFPGGSSSDETLTITVTDNSLCDGDATITIQLQNITGQPGMSVPLHWAQDGLPVGVHFAAGSHRDEMLFQLAYQLEAAKAWAQRLPPILAKENP